MTARMSMLTAAPVCSAVYGWECALRECGPKPLYTWLIVLLLCFCAVIAATVLSKMRGTGVCKRAGP